MIWYLVKLLVSALIIVLISEVSKKLPLLGSLIASIPLISVLGMIWMYGEKSKCFQNSQPCGRDFLVCTTILAYVFSASLDVTERNQFPFLSHCLYCAYWGTLFHDGQNFNKVWPEFIIPSGNIGLFSSCGS